MTRTQAKSLQAAIDCWLQQEAEQGFDFIIGDATVECMADAARAVFDACQEGQKYAKREGYLADPVKIHAVKKAS